MKLETVKEIDAVIEKHNGSIENTAAYIVANDGGLSREIIESWLTLVLPIWARFYNSLSDNVHEGHLKGPSPGQAYIMKRMRDKGHRVAPVRGFFRWLDGHDRRITRTSVRIMLERGWVRAVDGPEGTEFILELTEQGLFVLKNMELDTEDRAWP